MTMKLLIAYFSHKGENYFGGRIVYINKGNTAVVADKIREMTGRQDVLRQNETQCDYIEYFLLTEKFVYVKMRRVVITQI